MITQEGPAPVVGFLDWQGATVAPLFVQSGIPPFLRYTGDDRIIIEPGINSVPFPANYDTLPPEDQKHLAHQRRFALRQKFYELQVMQHSLHHHAALSYPGIEYIMPFVQGLSCTWFQGSRILRDHLFQCYAHWDEIAPNVPFPLSVDEVEAKRHQKEHENLEIYKKHAESAARELGIEGDGWVSHERYEGVRKANDELMERWNEEATGGPYPFHNGAPSWFVNS